MDLDRRSGLIVARSQIYDICETLYIYYKMTYIAIIGIIFPVLDINSTLEGAKGKSVILIISKRKEIIKKSSSFFKQKHKETNQN